MKPWLPLSRRKGPPTSQVPRPDHGLRQRPQAEKQLGQQLGQLLQLGVRPHEGDGEVGRRHAVRVEQDHGGQGADHGVSHLNRGD